MQQVLPASASLGNASLKGWTRRRLTLLFAVVVLASYVATPNAIRTQGFFSFSRAWHQHWPFKTGRSIPAFLEMFAGPFVPVWATVDPNLKMQLDPADLVTSFILRSGTWEPGTLKLLEGNMPVGGTLIDVGAHVGWYSLNAVHVLGKSGHVIAVEPNPATLSKLEANISANGMGDVITVAPVACSDAEGTLQFFAAPRANTGESSLSRSNASQEGAAAQPIQVRARPLDDIVAEARLSRVDVIKIDVEGAELLVLRGASKTLDRFHPVVVVELVDHQLQSMGTSEKELRAFMASKGYVAKHSLEANTEFVPANR